MFKDKEFESSGDFSDVTASMVPKDDIQFDDFDFDLIMTKEDFGAASDKLQVKGSGKFKGEAFDFTLPINNLKVKYSLGEKYNHDMKFNSLVWEEQDFDLDVNADTMVTSGADLDKAALLDIVSAEINAAKTQIQEAKEENMIDFPMDTAVPFVMIFYATQFAESLTIGEKFMDFGFSMTHFNLLSER